MKKGMFLLTAVTALLLGFLIALIIRRAEAPGTFTVYGRRETVLPEPVYTEWDRGKMDINTASETELTDLPGIGPALAGRIVSYREENGPFEAPEGLLEVSGIGEKTLAALLPYITVAEGD